MHISHNFVATKTCPSYEFLVVFGQVRIWDWKCGVKRGLRWSAGQVRAKFLKLMQVRGGFKFCGCGVRAYTKFQSVQDSSRYCCNFSGGVALIVWFTTNGLCVKNSTIIYVARASNSKRDCEHDLYCCLLPQCEALHTCRLRFPIATVYKAEMSIGLDLSYDEFCWIWVGSGLWFSSRI